MAAFGGLIITNKGRALQAKAQIGTELKYTRIKIGDGHLGGQSIPTLTDLISPKMGLGITNLEVRPGGKAVLGTVLRNSEVTTGFYFREIGVFALDPDEGEVLYCYGNAGPNAEYIPPGGGPDIIEKYIDVVTIVQNAPNVSAEIDKSLVFATHRDVEKALIEAKQYTDDEIQNITAETIGAIPISEKGEVDGVATLDEEGHVPEGQLQKAFNYTDEQIEPIENELTPNQKATLSLKEGIQAVNVLSNSALQVQFEGRTLVNLLGRDGNCEDLSRFRVYNSRPGATVELDENIKKYGLKSFKFTGNGGGTYRFLTVDVNPNGYYVAILEYYHQSGNVGGLLIGDGSSTRNGFGEHTKSSYAVVGKSNEWQLIKVKFKGDETPTGKVTISASTIISTSDAVFNVDGIRLYELTEEEYNALDNMTDEEIAALYPYIDSVQHTRNPYVIAKGKNLLPSKFSNKDIGGVVYEFNKPYHYRTVEGSSAAREVIEVIGGQTYTFSAEKVVGRLWISTNNNNGRDAEQLETLVDVELDGEPIETSFTVPINRSYIRVIIYAIVLEPASSPVELKNWQLELGDTATEFEPYEETYLFGKDIVLAEGEKAYQRGRDWYKWQEWEQLELGENIPVDSITVRDFEGFKRVSLLNFIYGHVSDGHSLPENWGINKLVKYDGKLLKSIGTTEERADTFVLTGTNSINISISNQDSGWGDDYTPTPEEIKAYFNGWQMNNGTFGQPYNGTGTKTWVPLGDTDNSRATTTLPTSVSPTITEGKITHYQLHYKLAEPREVPIEFEGSLRVSEGLNQIEVGTGVVVRERANPVLSNGFVRINQETIPESRLNYRTDKLVTLFKGSKPENVSYNFNSGWYYDSKDTAYGNERYTIREALYDFKESYFVTYFVLDKHLFTAGLGGVQAEYNTNLATRLEENEKELIAQVRKVSVLENELFPLLGSSEVVDHNLHVENPPLGHYIRWANGLQVCWRTVVHNMNTNFVQQWFYPATFKRPLADNVIATGHPNYFMEDGVVTNSEFWDKLYTITIGAHPDVPQWFTLSRQPHLIDARVKLALLAVGRWK